MNIIDYDVVALINNKKKKNLVEIHASISRCLINLDLTVLMEERDVLKLRNQNQNTKKKD